MDGLEEHQDKTRRYINGLSTYSIIKKNVSKVIDCLGGVSAISVVSSANVSDLNKISEEFEKMGISAVRFSPVYPTLDNKNYVPEKEILSKSMTEVFDNYLDKLIRGEEPIRILNLQGLMRTLFRDKKT